MPANMYNSNYYTTCIHVSIPLPILYHNTCAIICICVATLGLEWHSYVCVRKFRKIDILSHAKLLIRSYTSNPHNSLECAIISV